MARTVPMMDYEDLEIECCTCHEVFVWSAGEQMFFAERGLQRPRRCKPCRAMKAERISHGKTLPGYRG